MRIDKILLYTGYFLLAGCHFTEEEKHAQPKKEIAKKVTVYRQPVAPQSEPYSGQYCFVKKLYTVGSTSYIEADYIEFLMGKAALDAASKRGEADMVMDDYYILNENTKLRTLTLSGDVVIQLVNNINGKSFFENSTPDSLAKRLKDGIFVLQINNGLVTAIKEQFLP